MMPTVTTPVSTSREPSRTPSTAYTDLREWLDAVDGFGELRRISGADWNLEIGGLTELMAHRVDSPPALLFDDIPGYPAGHRVLTLSMESPKRLALTLGMPDDLRGVQLVDTWRRRSRALEIRPCRPIEGGPVRENILTGRDIDLEKFPAPFWNELDGGRYLGTGCIAITRDPDTGWVNAGTYRMMIQGPDRLGIYRSPGRHASAHEQKYFERGLPFPIAVSVGHDPLLVVAGGLPLPKGLNELEWAGAVKGRPIDVTTAPYTGLPVPAGAEIVIEGELIQGEGMPEGPYGEYTGYYASESRIEPFIRVKSILHRNDPVILGFMCGRPPQDGDYFDIVGRCALTWNALEASGVPDVVGVWHLQPELFCVVAIKQRYAGHAKQAGLIASQAAGSGYMGRYVVVVDEDIDITDYKEVLWAICTRVDPVRDIDIIDGCWSGPLDPAIHPDEKGTNSRAIIDATRPYQWRDRFPKATGMSKDLERKLLQKWGEDFLSARATPVRRP